MRRGPKRIVPHVKGPIEVDVRPHGRSRRGQRRHGSEDPRPSWFMYGFELGRFVVRSRSTMIRRRRRKRRAK